jgi:hypothetical protein
MEDKFQEWMLGKARSHQGNRHHKTTINMEHFYYKNMSAIHQYSTLPQHIKQFPLSLCLYTPIIIHMVNILHRHCSFNNCNWEQVIVQKSCIKLTKLWNVQKSTVLTQSLNVTLLQSHSCVGVLSTDGTGRHSNLDTITQNIMGNSEAHLGCAFEHETETDRERETEGREVSLSLHATCREKVTYPPNLSWK